MTYLTQLQQQSNKETLRRKKEYIQYNFGKFIDCRLQKINCRVLEIGPGLGEFVEYCNDKEVQAIDVIDRDKGILTYLRSTYKINQSFDSLTLFFDKKGGLYDIIMLTQVLEHIPKEEHIDLLKKLYGRLSVGGIILITVPNIGNPLAIYERYYDYTHETAFTDHSLIQMADFADLAKSEVFLRPFRIPPYSLINILRSALQSLLHVIFKLLFIVNGGVYPRILTTNISLIIEKKIIE